MGTEVQSNDKFYMTLKAAMNMPGVMIRRDEYLQKELSMRFKEDVVVEAIKYNPAKAGISLNELESISKESIKLETNRVTGISAIAGIPGGIAMVGTVTADTIQYFGHILRILQKLIYLYGWKEIYNEDGEFDDGTTNVLITFMGVMFGVEIATTAVRTLAKTTALRLQKTLTYKPLTQGVVYPIVKKVATALGVKMTKQVFANGVGKLIPLFGAVISGGVTFVTFKPSAEKLKKHLIELPNASIDFYKDNSIVVEIKGED